MKTRACHTHSQVHAYALLLYTYTESSNLIGPLPLNNFLYSTPTTAHAHEVIKCQFEENLAGNGSG